MSNVESPVIRFSGKYNALLNGFRYRSGRVHPSFDWLSKVNVVAVASAIDVLDPNYDKLLKEALIKEYKEVILTNPERPPTINWYQWAELANSIS